MHSDLGHRSRGDVLEVTLTRGANVRLLRGTQATSTSTGVGRSTGTRADSQRSRRLDSRSLPMATGTESLTCRACVAPHRQVSA